MTFPTVQQNSQCRPAEPCVPLCYSLHTGDVQHVCESGPVDVQQLKEKNKNSLEESRDKQTTYRVNFRVDGYILFFKTSLKGSFSFTSYIKCKFGIFFSISNHLASLSYRYISQHIKNLIGLINHFNAFWNLFVPPSYEIHLFLISSLLLDLHYI